MGLVVCVLSVLCARWFLRSERERERERQREKEDEGVLRHSEAAGNDEAPATEEAVEIELGERGVGKLGTVEEGTVYLPIHSLSSPPILP